MIDRTGIASDDCHTPAIHVQFAQFLIGKALPPTVRSFYTKWLRFYWDFCHKYRHDPLQSDSLPLFLKKLQDKHQSEPQRKQAQQAISLFYEMQTASTLRRAEGASKKRRQPLMKSTRRRPSRASLDESVVGLIPTSTAGDACPGSDRRCWDSNKPNPGRPSSRPVGGTLLRRLRREGLDRLILRLVQIHCVDRLG
jgi:hypothetical protein